MILSEMGGKKRKRATTHFDCGIHTGKLMMVLSAWGERRAFFAYSHQIPTSTTTSSFLQNTQKPAITYFLFSLLLYLNTMYYGLKEKQKEKENGLPQ